MSTRANPERSFDAACRHLFRHLYEATQLRRNPLVGECFARDLRGLARGRSDNAITSAIRAAVRRHAEACFEIDKIKNPERAELQRAVIEADLDGSSRIAVAARLGLSARQYTRLQHDIRTRIAVAIRTEIVAAAVAATDHSDVKSPLPAIAEFAARGRPIDALTRLSTVVEGAGDALSASALCLRATICQRQIGDLAGAAHALLAARKLLSSVSSDDALASSARAEVALAVIEMDVMRGSYGQATERATRLANSLGRTNAATATLVLRANTAAAYGNLVTGKPADALRYVAAALSLQEVVGSAPAIDQVEIALEIAVVLGELGRISESSAVLAQAWQIARRARFPFDLVRINLIHATLALEYGIAAAAEKQFVQATEAARELNSPSLTARALAYLTRAQMREERPRPDQILRNARRALELSRAYSSEWIGAKTGESFAKLLLGDDMGAERAARDADDAAAATANHVYRGSTLREMARVAAAQGRKRDATRAIKAAIDAGYKAGKRQQSIQALALAARILGERSYSAEAGALQKTIATSGPFFPLPGGQPTMAPKS